MTLPGVTRRQVSKAMTYTGTPKNRRSAGMTFRPRMINHSGFHQRQAAEAYAAAIHSMGFNGLILEAKLRQPPKPEPDIFKGNKVVWKPKPPLPGNR